MWSFSDNRRERVQICYRMKEGSVREIAKELNAEFQGRGGGKPDMAMAGGKDASKIDDALMRADEILRNMLK